MKRILVTGASGFIGRHALVLLAARGYEVHAVSLASPPSHYKEVAWHQANLLKHEEVTRLIVEVRPSHLLHFAWYVAPGNFWNSPENFRWVEASFALVREFHAHAGQRVIIAGSCAEYDWRYGYCSEALTPLMPATVYGTCKHALHSMVGAYCKVTGLSYAWGRIFLLYGPGEAHGRLVPSVIGSLLQDQPALCTHGRQVRDFLHVEDVARAFVDLLDGSVPGAVNIGSGIPISVGNLVYKIAVMMNKSHLVRLGALATQPNEPDVLLPDTRRLVQEIGWSPKYDLDTGLTRTLSWYQDNARL